MDQGLLCILRADHRDELIGQRERWDKIGARLALGVQYHDISGMTPDEAIASLLPAVERHGAGQVAIESLASLAPSGSEAVRVAEAILATGARLLVLSYAVRENRLVELDRKMLKRIDAAFLEESEDDLLFLSGYARRPVELEDLLYHLKSLEESLATRGEDAPPHLIAADLRRIALLVRRMQRQPQSKISAN